MNLPLEAIQEALPEAWRQRLIGLRFLAPVLAMPLVEVTYRPGISQRSEARRRPRAALRPPGHLAAHVPRSAPRAAPGRPRARPRPAPGLQGQHPVAKRTAMRACAAHLERATRPHR